MSLSHDFFLQNRTLFSRFLVLLRARVHRRLAWSVPLKADCITGVSASPPGEPFEGRVCKPPPPAALVSSVAGGLGSRNLSPHVLEAGSLRSRCLQGHAPRRLQGRSPPASSNSGGSWPPCVPWLVSASLPCAWALSHGLLRVCVCVHLCLLSLIKTLAISYA